MWMHSRQLHAGHATSHVEMSLKAMCAGTREPSASHAVHNSAGGCGCCKAGGGPTQGSSGWPMARAATAECEGSLAGQQPGQSAGLRNPCTVQADATEANQGLDCMRASSGEPLAGNAVNDGESSPSWEAASAAETDAAACRRSDGTASGALLPEYLHPVLPELWLRCEIMDTLPEGQASQVGPPQRLSLIKTPA